MTQPRESRAPRPGRRGDLQLRGLRVPPCYADPTSSGISELELPAQALVLGAHALELVAATQFTRTRDWSSDADRLRVFEVGVDGRDDDARLDSHQVDPDQGDSHPGIDDDSLVEHTIEDVDEG